jgi:hypothetical protein
MNRCNAWVGGLSTRAHLCSQCGFGNGVDQCCVCNKWIGPMKNQAGVLLIPFDNIASALYFLWIRKIRRKLQQMWKMVGAEQIGGQHM